MMAVGMTGVVDPFALVGMVAVVTISNFLDP